MKRKITIKTLTDLAGLQGEITFRLQAAEIQFSLLNLGSVNRMWIGIKLTEYGARRGSVCKMEEALEQVLVGDHLGNFPGQELPVEVSRG
ncbi:MAG: hypothetical protein Q9175_006866 [Cornicularia normoerica]